MRHMTMLAFFSALTACTGGGGDDAPDDTTNDDGKTGLDEQGYGCEPSESALGIDEVSSLGFAPATLIDLADGEHLATMTWADDSDSELTLTLALDPSSARFVDLEVHYPEDATSVPAIDIYCEDYVALRGTLTVTTADGRLDESMEVELTSTDGASTSLREELTIDALGGTLVFDDFHEEADYDERSLWLDAGFDEAGTFGSLDGQVTGEDDCEDGEACVAWAALVEVGSWGRDDE